MTFSDRMASAKVFESDLIDRLNSMGWRAWPFGQGLLPEECRNALKRFRDDQGNPSLIRWMPDILAVKTIGHGSSVALIDAKKSNADYSSYTIEIKAVETMEIYAKHLFTPTFFVFDDYRVLTPSNARALGVAGPPPKFGSGTPYILVQKLFSQPMEDVFNAVAP